MDHLVAKVCIVGAGPAGMATAFYLNKLKIPHLLIESKNFPRPKVCGECYDGRVARILDEIDPALLPEMQREGIVENTWDFSLHLNNTHLKVTYAKSVKPRLQTQRAEFDHFLFEKLKQQPFTQFMVPASVRSIEEKGNHVFLKTGHCTIEAKVVVVATGSQSAFSAKSTAKTVFVRGYFDHLPTQNQETEFFFNKKPFDHFLCINPVSRGRSNVLLGVKSKALKKNGIPLKQAYEAIIEAPGFKQRFECAQLGEPTKGTFMPNQLAVPFRHSARVLYSGAALFGVNTISGMGVGNAMTIGKLAAHHIAENLASDQFDLRSSRKFYREIKRKLKPIVRIHYCLTGLQNNFHLLGLAVNTALIIIALHKHLLKIPLYRMFWSTDYSVSIDHPKGNEPSKKQQESLVS